MHASEPATSSANPVEDQPVDPKKRYLCRHIFTDGHRCGSPALRDEVLCYYHVRTRTVGASAGRSGTFRMPRIDDRSDIQIALFDVLCRVAGGDIEYRRGSVLLYGLQIASSNLARREKQEASHPLIEELTKDYDLGDLAPIQEVPATAQETKTPETRTQETKAPETKPLRTPAPPPAVQDQSTTRVYTREEKEFFESTTTPLGYEPDPQHPCPKSITRADLVNVINASRLTLGIGPVQKEPGWSPVTLSTRPREQTALADPPATPEWKSGKFPVPHSVFAPPNWQPASGKPKPVHQV